MGRDLGGTRTALTTFAALLFSALAINSSSAAERRPIAIEAGPATQTLRELSRATDLQIISAYEDVLSVITHSVSGNLKPLEALRQLLYGTKLRFKALGKGAVLVYSPAHKKLTEHPEELAASDVDIFGPSREPSETVTVQSEPEHGHLKRPPGVDPEFIRRKDIERSSVSSTPDLVSTLPENFNGGPNEATTRGESAETNTGFGSGVNLHGLSDGSSVILLNGHRLAPSGSIGAFTDIANIPLSAIDTLEVFPVGATTRYGADAVGGILNFVIRQDAGWETRASREGLGDGELDGERFSQSFGARWDTGKVFMLAEYDKRDALPAASRRLATSNLVPFGGSNFNTLYGNPGTIELVTPETSLGYTTWAIPRNQNGSSLTAAQFVPGTANSYDVFKGTDVLPQQRLASFLLSGTQEIADSFSTFLDVLAAHRTAESIGAPEGMPLTVTSANPFYVNPLGGTDPVTVLYGFGRDMGPVITHGDINTGQVTAGFDYEGGLFDHLELYGTYAYERQHQIQDGQVNPGLVEEYINDPPPGVAPLNVFGDGSYTAPRTLAAIRAQSNYGLTSLLGTIDLSADRTVFEVFGGNAVLTLDGNYRRETLQSAGVNPGGAVIGPNYLGRTTLSAFAQTAVPLVSAVNALPGLEILSVAGAVRYDHYSDVGRSMSPQFAVEYSPWRSLLLRGTYARLFHAPELPDLSEVGNVSALQPLPTSNSTYTTALVWNGGNTSLKPERAVSWTAGFNYLPATIPALSLALTYFRTNFTSRISQQASLTEDVLEDPASAWLLRPVSVAERTNICTHSQFVGTAAQCLSAPIGAIVDLTLQNVASLYTQGLDVATRYEIKHGPGTWNFGLNATYMLEYAEKQTPPDPVINLLNTDHNPINLRLRGTLSWEGRALWARAAVNFQNSYEDVDSTTHRAVGSWTTVDAALGYDLKLWPREVPKGTEVTLGARNLFNHQPPFLNSQYGIGYDQENANLVGRVVTLGVRQRW